VADVRFGVKWLEDILFNAWFIPAGRVDERNADSVNVRTARKKNKKIKKKKKKKKKKKRKEKKKKKKKKKKEKKKKNKKKAVRFL